MNRFWRSSPSETPGGTRIYLPEDSAGVDVQGDPTEGTAMGRDELDVHFRIRRTIGEPV